MQELPRERQRGDPRRLRLEVLLGRVGTNTVQFYRDAGRLVRGEVALETGSHLVGHCAREIESALREVLVLMLIPDEELKPIRKDGAKNRTTHKLEVEALISKLRLPQDRDAVVLWREIASGDEALAARTHRRRQKAPPPIEQTRPFWERYEQLIEVLAAEIERRFAGLLGPIRALAAVVTPTDGDVTRLGEMPNAYVLRREFFEQAGPEWLVGLDEAHYFDRPEGFAEDPNTGERLLVPWPQSSYLKRIAPAAPDRFVAVALRITPAHEFMANDIVAGGRSIPAAAAAPLAQHVAGFIGAQSAPLFLIAGDCAAWAADLIAAGETDAGEALLAALLGGPSNSENGTGE